MTTASAQTAEAERMANAHLSVNEAWAAVMVDVEQVGKTGHNKSQNYSFRGVDAVVNAVGPALRRHGVVVVPVVEDATYREITVGQNRTLMREVTVRVRYRIIGPKGDTIEGVVYGESMDSGDKGTAKAFSVAFRTFLLQALCIPTDEPDPDSASYERAPREATPPPATHRGGPPECVNCGQPIVGAVAPHPDGYAHKGDCPQVGPGPELAPGPGQQTLEGETVG